MYYCDHQLMVIHWKWYPEFPPPPPPPLDGGYASIWSKPESSQLCTDQLIHDMDNTLRIHSRFQIPGIGVRIPRVCIDHGQSQLDGQLMRQKSG